ncbi:integrase [Lysobacter enzymogenes]|uniref:site-specific integrase n=1 Tax=Lysobacter enzymogenes TaxID=69 RepID=UPI00339656E1
MPKPYFLSRPSGLYVRFRVPDDVRHKVGLRFIVRALGPLRGDSARLLAARQAVALSAVFDRLRKGDGEMAGIDPKKLIESAERSLADGSAREWTGTDVQIGGVRFGSVTTHGAEDTLDFIATMKAAVELQAALGTRSPPEPAAPAPPPISPPAVASAEPKLSKAIETYLADLEAAKRDRKTIIESRHSLRILLGVIGDVPSSTLSQDHARTFFDAVRHWPSNATKRPEYRDLDVAQVVALSKTNAEPEPAAHTINKHRQRLSAFVQSLLAARVLAHNPLKGIVWMTEHAADADVETGRAFTTEELQAIFDKDAFGAWAKKYPHRFWGPILGLYSGARVTEIAQLYAADIETIDGVPGFHITRRFDGQKIKNKQSKRFVPLAKPVIDAGFLDYVAEVRQAGHERLFPHLPNSTGLGFGRQLSRQFSTYIKKRGVADSGVGFHAFRHTFATLLDKAGESMEAISRLTGHWDGQQAPSTLGKFYIHRETIPLRVATLAKFAPGVAVPNYTRGQFAKSLTASGPVDRDSEE